MFAFFGASAPRLFTPQIHAHNTRRRTLQTSRAHAITQTHTRAGSQTRQIMALFWRIRPRRAHVYGNCTRLSRCLCVYVCVCFGFEGGEDANKISMAQRASNWRVIRACWPFNLRYSTRSSVHRNPTALSVFVKSRKICQLHTPTPPQRSIVVFVKSGARGNNRGHRNRSGLPARELINTTNQMGHHWHLNHFADAHVARVKFNYDSR